MKRQIFVIAMLLWAIIVQCHAQVFKMKEEPRLVFVDKEHYVAAAMQLDDYLPLIPTSSAPTQTSPRYRSRGA